MKNLLILIISISFVFGCSKTDDIVVANCNVLQTLDEVNELINLCDLNEFDSQAEIENRLKGDWTLSGIKSGWGAPFEPVSECLLLSISDKSLVLKNQETNEESSSNWELEFYEVNNLKVFFLSPNDQKLRYTVGMQSFSENIMYGAGNAEDTDIYVYERMN